MDEMKAVTLFITLSKKDFDFMELTIPHIIKGCNYPFKQIILLVDPSNAEGFHRKFDINIKFETFWNKCSVLAGHLENAIVLEINQDRNKLKQITEKYFGRSVYEVKDFRGNLWYGFILGIESALTNYVVHFDSDILIHSDNQYSWVKEGLEIIDKYEDIISVSPLPGPPRKDKKLIQDKDVNWILDERGFYKFRSFSTREFLIKKSRIYCNFLPLPIKYSSWKRHLWSKVFGGSALWPLEWLIDSRLNESLHFRADIASGKSWTLHTPDHGVEFCNYLPDIIRAVENNRFPLENAGKYDLDLYAFVKLIDSEKMERANVGKSEK